MPNQISRCRVRCRHRSLAIAAILFMICSGSDLGMAQNGAAKRVPGAIDRAALVSRGEYIVEGVARCGQCHTPKDAQGNPDPAKTLEGAPVWWKPAEPTPDWPLQAPRIAGSPPGSDDEMITLLTTGIWRDGKPLRPPMPQFHMTRQDAEAVIAYLRSLNPKPR